MRILACLAAILALGLVGCGGGGKEGGEARLGGKDGGQARPGVKDGRQARPGGVVNVGRVLKRGEQLGRPSVRGRVFPLSGSQLVLAGKQRSLILMAKPALARRARRPGQVVVVTGPVRRLSPSQANRLAASFAKLERRGSKPPPEVARAPRSAGTPYVELKRLTPAGKAKPQP